MLKVLSPLHNLIISLSLFPGVDALLSADPISSAQVAKIADWITSIPEIPYVSYGFHLDGVPIDSIYSSFFNSPMGIAAMVQPKQNYLNYIYELVKQTYQGYYEDSVTMMSLLVMSGNWWDPTL